VIDRQPTQPGDVPQTFADISKARRLLGYAPTTQIEEGIRRFVQWFKLNAER
jgi:UDP-glucuronate 4-epimerase